MLWTPLNYKKLKNIGFFLIIVIIAAGCGRISHKKQEEKIVLNQEEIKAIQEMDVLEEIEVLQDMDLLEEYETIKNID